MKRKLTPTETASLEPLFPEDVWTQLALFLPPEFLAGKMNRVSKFFRNFSTQVLVKRHDPKAIAHQTQLLALFLSRPETIIDLELIWKDLWNNFKYVPFQEQALWLNFFSKEPPDQVQKLTKNVEKNFSETGAANTILFSPLIHMKLNPDLLRTFIEMKLPKLSFTSPVSIAKFFIFIYNYSTRFTADDIQKLIPKILESFNELAPLFTISQITPTKLRQLFITMLSALAKITTKTNQENLTALAQAVLIHYSWHLRNFAELDRYKKNIPITVNVRQFFESLLDLKQLDDGFFEKLAGFFRQLFQSHKNHGKPSIQQELYQFAMFFDEMLNPDSDFRQHYFQSFIITLDPVYSQVDCFTPNDLTVQSTINHELNAILELVEAIYKSPQAVGTFDIKTYKDENYFQIIKFLRELIAMNQPDFSGDQCVELASMLIDNKLSLICLNIDPELCVNFDPELRIRPESKESKAKSALFHLFQTVVLKLSKDKAIEYKNRLIKIFNMKFQAYSPDQIDHMFIPDLLLKIKQFRACLDYEDFLKIVDRTQFCYLHAGSLHAGKKWLLIKREKYIMQYFPLMIDVIPEDKQLDFKRYVIDQVIAPSAVFITVPFLPCLVFLFGLENNPDELKRQVVDKIEQDSPESESSDQAVKFKIAEPLFALVCHRYFNDKEIEMLVEKLFIYIPTYLEELTAMISWFKQVDQAMEKKLNNQPENGKVSEVGFWEKLPVVSSVQPGIDPSDDNSDLDSDSENAYQPG